MDAIRMQATTPTPTSNTTATAASSNANAANAGTEGTASFSQALVQVLNDGTEANANETPSALLGALMPGLIGGMPTNAEAQAATPAEALLQLLAQLLNGAQQNQDGLGASTDSEATGDVSGALAQLQLLLVQFLSSQTSNTSKSDSSAAQSGTMLLDKQNSSSEQLLQVVTAILNAQTKTDSKPVSFQAFSELLKPVLAEAAAAVASAAQTTQQQTAASAAGTPTSQPIAAYGESFIPLGKKPVKETQPNNPASSLPVSQVTVDGRSKISLDWLAAKANLQTPAPAVAPNTPTATANGQPEALIEAPLEQGESNSSQGAASFRLPTSTDAVVKADAPVVSANRFAQEMSQLMKSMNIQNADGHSSIRITLTPDHLGQVDVKMSMQNGHLVAQFVADSVHGKDMLESQLPQLRAVLQSQGLTVDRLEVTQGQGAAFANFQEQRQQQSSQQFNRKQQGRSADGEDTAIDFDAELAQLAARRAALAGSSFDASA